MKTLFVNKFLAFTTKISIAFANHQDVLSVIGTITLVQVNDQYENYFKDPLNLTVTDQKTTMMTMEDAYVNEKNANITTGKRLEMNMQLMSKSHNKLISKS